MKTPLKTILRNFLKHVEDIETRRILGDDVYEVEFQKLKQLTDRLKEDAQYLCSHGQKEVNRPKNRYKDIVPYDFSRVLLPEYSSIPGSDYINASYIKGASGAYAYIAAQGPLPNTSVDFWKMIWVTETQVVVMACNEVEAGKFKCESYWPTEGETKVFGNISISLVKWTQECPDFLIRTLSVKQQGEERLICQFHYTTWPDHGVPETVQSILELVRLVRDCQATETVPILIHCSAGCGRTGTICAIDFIWACLRSGKLSESFCLYDIVAEMRQQRIAMVQTKEQYALVHKAVASMFEQQLRVIDSHIYENLDEDGEPLMWKELLKVENSKELGQVGSSSAIKGKNGLKQEILPKTNLDRMNVGQGHTKSESINRMDRSDLPTNVALKEVHHFYCTNHVKPKYNTLPAKSANKDFKPLVSKPVADVHDLLPLPKNLSIKSDTKQDCKLNTVFTGGSDETIPFIDDEDEVKLDNIKVRAQGGRAYINLPSCDSISKIINAFDPFVDKLSLGTDDNSPDYEVSVPIDNMFSCKDPYSEENLESRTKCSSSHVDELSAFNISKNKTSVLKGSSVDLLKLSAADGDIVVIDASKHVSESSEKSDIKKDCLYKPLNKDSNVKSICKSSSPDSCRGEQKLSRQVDKSTIMRRPSIAKLKALFDKSGTTKEKSKAISGNRPGSKHSSSHMPRAGSAPPSLSCINRNGDEKDSLFSMVTRKFRSSSVKTEHELQKEKKSVTSTVTFPKKSKSNSLSQFRTSIANLTRNVSFGLGKGPKLPLFSQNKCHNIAEANSVDSEICKLGAEIPLNHGKVILETKHSGSDTQWYDVKTLNGNQIRADPDQIEAFTCSSVKESLSVVDKLEDNFLALSSVQSADDAVLKGTSTLHMKDMSLIDKEKDEGSSVNCFERKPKIYVPFFNNLSKVNSKVPSTLWYKLPDIGDHHSKVPLEANEKISESTHSNDKEFGDILITECAKAGHNSSDSMYIKSNKHRENLEPIQSENVAVIQLANSKFYTPANKVTEKPPVLPQKKKAQSLDYPIPEEIIEIGSELIKKEKNPPGFWPPSSLSISSENEILTCAISKADKEENEVPNDPNSPSKSIEFTTLGKPEQHKTETVDYKLQLMYSDLKENPVISYKTQPNIIAQDLPPAVPKKMILGKQKSAFPDVLSSSNDIFSVHSSTNNTLCTSDKNVNEQISSNQSLNFEGPVVCKENVQPNRRGDTYMNVNVIAKKNIEQIENTLRNHPRGAIIDLTSRESYSMEEELSFAINQLDKPKPCLHKDSEVKFHGYEVIWPKSRDSICTPYNNFNQKNNQKPDSCVKPSENVKQKNELQFLKSAKPSKTGKLPATGVNYEKGLCYSPPLRRNLNSSFSISKSQSCISLDWLELEQKKDILDKQIDVFDDNSAKTLVNEAVIELTTLLDQLTTRTLSENIDVNANSTNKVEETSILNNTNATKSVSTTSYEEQNIMTCKAELRSASDPCKNEILEIDSKVETFNVSKPLPSISCSKDDEVIFHFPPPPPPLPQPPGEHSVQEHFEVSYKNGRILLSSGSSENDAAAECLVNITSEIQVNSLEDSSIKNVSSEAAVLSQIIPTPIPRKTKQDFQESSARLKRSASYSMLTNLLMEIPMNENQNIEKCLTLPHLLNYEISHNFQAGDSENSSVGFSNDLVDNSHDSKPLHGVCDKNPNICFSGNPDYEVIYPIQDLTSPATLKKDVSDFKSDTRIRHKDDKQHNTTAAIISMVDALIHSSPKHIDAERSTVVSLDLSNVDSSAIPFVRLKQTHVASSSVIDPKIQSSTCLPLSQSYHPRYENVGVHDTQISESPEITSKSVVQKVCNKNSRELSNDLTEIKESHGGPINHEQRKTNEFPIYGKVNKIPKTKICTVAPRQLQSDGSHDIGSKENDLHVSKNTPDKKKLIPSRKAERAPLPPCPNPDQFLSSFVPKKVSQSENSAKKLPSRKHEKAPEPPQLHICASPKGISEVECYSEKHKDSIPPTMSVPLIQQRKPKLNALYENISQTQAALQNDDVVEEGKLSMVSHLPPNAGYGLKHSSSDASVFLALRGRKYRSPHSRREFHVLHVPNEISMGYSKGDSSSIDSSGDSDNSLRQAVDVRVYTSSRGKSIANPETLVKKEVPVAPPRSKRRNTMEIHFFQKQGGEAKIPNLQARVPSRSSAGIPKSTTNMLDEPPAIPTKTREAYEVPDEFELRGNRMSAPPIISSTMLKLPDKRKLPPRKPLH